MHTERQVLKNFDEVTNRVHQACLLSGRDTNSVKILAVTKYADPKDILTLLAGRRIYAVAESRLQEGLAKWTQPDLARFQVKKFFIGHLQTNKAAKVLQYFDVICSLDSLKLAAVLDASAQKLGKRAQCLIQVKLTQKQAQGGISLQDAQQLIKEVRGFKNIDLKGIMAIAPQQQDGQDIKNLFGQVKVLFDGNFGPDDYLSLGMSGDLEAAIAAGSNLPRIGSAIFGRD